MAVFMMLVAFGLGLLIGPKYIKKLKKMKMGQFIREAGPVAHSAKSGTPTMGGGIFLIPLIIMSLFVLDLGRVESWLIIATVIMFAIIGGIDDFAKLLKKQNEGLTSKQKFLIQLAFSLAIVLVYVFTVGDTTIWIPFVDKTFDLGWMYVVFMLFVIVGASNATNLTDGLDGLLASNAIVSFVGFAVISIIVGNQEVEMLSWVAIGAVLSFLVFNFHPARVFMGDMGSLSLGAMFAVMAMVLKVEILLMFLGAIYVFETLSVIIQVFSFKVFKKRVFRMSPVHHHFELKGMHEKEVVTMFVIIQFVMVVLAILMV